MLEDKVVLLGERRDVPAILSGCAVSVCIQNPHLRRKGGGISVASIESMAAGTAVVAWDSRQYTQVIEHSKTGYLVPTGTWMVWRTPRCSFLPTRP